MTDQQQAKAEYDQAIHNLALLYNEIKEHPQRFAAPYDAWITARLRVWKAREQLKEAERNEE